MERICAHTWDDGDYIPYVWDEWLADPQGVMIAGDLGGHMVALARINLHAPGQAWLEGMRVDPAYRGRGIGWRFLQYCLDYARQHGMRVARLATASGNTTVHHQAERAGMGRVGAYAHWYAEPLSGGDGPSLLRLEDQGRVEAFVRNSPVLAFGHGLVGLGWSFQDLTPAVVLDLLRQGGFAALEKPDGGLAALATFRYDAEEQLLRMGFVDGEPAAVTELALALRRHGSRLGAQTVRIAVPELEWLREALRAAGFDYGEWRGELWVFELRLN